MGSTAILNNVPVDNFFIAMAATVQYDEVKKKMSKDHGEKKKVYTNMKKMLRECYFIGSLKYGNNFIV